MKIHSKSRRISAHFVSTLLVAALTSACEKEVVEPPERIRAVKTIVVAVRASGQLRKFPGTVQPVDTSSISFEVTGLVQEIGVDRGDKVKDGEVLAVLDKKPFELNVESAKAALSRAQARLTEKKSGYDRERRIQSQDPGATTQKAVDQARAAYESTRQNVSYSRAQLDLARRDLAKTELRSPFDGVVSDRHIEPFEEVSRGKPVLDLFVDGAMEVAVGVPENMIGDVHVGLRGEVRLPNRPDDVYHAVVSKVGSAATSANAFPVEANIQNADVHIRPGMTAELALLFARHGEEAAYLVPLQSMAPSLPTDERYLYVFDPGSSTVRKTIVKGRGVIGDQVIITAGIEPGDLIVVAGVPFLRDGQKVKLMGSTQPAQ
ncbi:MAG: efflux RND transporter periplasmic adaptor subunit [Gammaproteobacteria bacterium]|jgi:RND family efflux transporter MFP subunit|nr:efflux RND transporter periplasmic adaptor subunit [Gammaproteobacteria bacterium]